MLKRLLTVSLALFAAASVGVAIPQVAIASPADNSGEPELPSAGPNRGGGEPPLPTTVGTGVNDGTVTVDLTAAGSRGGGSEQPVAPPTYTPTCTWTPLRGGEVPGVEGSNPLPGGGEQAVDSEGRLGWTVICPGEGLQVRWTTPTPDPITLVQPASDRARALLPAPVPDQSPAPDVGSIVNLGLWMSIEDPGVTSARATVAGVWAEATGRFVGFSVDPGDGTPAIACEGFGVAYPEGSDDPEEGPCGHTYLQTTPDDAPHTVTYTITYEISWQTSDGRSGTVGTFDRTFQFPFDIDEIQTVGTGV